MNYVTDDWGRSVPAIGAPGSVARVACERPKLLGQLNALYFQSHDSPGRAVDEALELIRKNGISSAMETASLLKASNYGSEGEGSVTSMVLNTLGEPPGKSADTGVMVATAQAIAARLKEQGWTRTNFAHALRGELERGNGSISGIVPEASAKIPKV
jgi:hypothetical protein